MKLVKLKDITSKITKGTTPSKSDGGFSSIGVNYIKAESVSYEGRIDESKFAFITEAVHKKLKRSQLQENDILFSMAGAFLGKTGFVMKHHIPANTNQALALIRVKPEIAYPKFIHYYLQQKSVVHFVNNAVSQSAQPNINLQQIGDLDICLLSLAQQQRVVEILDAIDNKITLNRQINQTLEQMAQTLFKSWFVDFDPVIDNALDAGFFEQDLGFSDELLHRVEIRKAVRESGNFKPLSEDIRRLFPNAFEECVESALGLGGWVPKKWVVTSLENVTSLIIDHRGKTPNKLGGEWSKKGYPAISAKNIKNGRLIRPDTIRYVDSKLYAKWMKDPLCAGDILMTSEAPVGELFYLVKDCEYLLSQRLYGIRANKEIISGCYLYFWLQTNIARADIDGRTTGTTVVGIRQSELKQLKVMVPVNAVVDVFSNLTNSYLTKVQSNEKQILELEKLRDTLLPKLISGELSLSNIKIDIPEETLI
ncbi:restriction endonuclease subunit S [Proteus mirabilis]|uniref:restriction endonuclease subunit S n=1 Tax=Proteus mirabilis TaxID=584 RepID=UPI0036A13346